MARTPRHSMARSPMTRSPMATRQVVKRVMATDSLQILRGRHFARFLRIRRFVHRFRVQTLPYVVHATGGEDRTLRRTHIFQSLLVSRMPEHIKSRTHVCGLRLDDPCHRVVCCLVAHPKSFHLKAFFHTTLLGVPDTFSPFRSSPPRTTPTTRPGIWEGKAQDFANNTEGVAVAGKDRQNSRKGKRNRGGRRDRARHERKRLATGWCDRFRGKREENVGIAPSPQQP